MSKCIALDGRLLAWPGIGRYLQELSQALVLEAPDFHFRWISRASEVDRWPVGDRARALVAPFEPLTITEQRRWRGWIRQQGIDLWHSPVAHHIPWLGGTPLVVTMHDMILHRMPSLAPGAAGYLYYRIANAIAMRRARAVVCISQATWDDVHSIWPASKARLHVVHHGISSKFQALPDKSVVTSLRQRFALPRSYLLYVGTCKPHKNLPRLLEAYAALPEALRDDCPLVLLVKLRDRNPQADAAAQRFRLGPWLRWIEGLDETELIALYSGARAVVLVSPIEGWGMPVTEAMACGTPSVVTAGSAQAEAAGVSGLTCDAYNVESIRAALQTILLDDALHARLARAALARAAEFDWLATARAVARIYRDVLK